jgi:hypothetical protein
MTERRMSWLGATCTAVVSVYAYTGMKLPLGPVILLNIVLVFAWMICVENPWKRRQEDKMKLTGKE